MIVEIAGRMTGVVVMLTRPFLLTGLVAMTVVVEIAGLVARVIVVFAGFFRCHVGSPMRVQLSTAAHGDPRPKRRQHSAHEAVNLDLKNWRLANPRAQGI